MFAKQRKKVFAILLFIIFFSYSILLAKSKSISVSFKNKYGYDVKIKPLISCFTKNVGGEIKTNLAYFLYIETDSFYYKNYKVYVEIDGNKYSLEAPWGNSGGSYLSSYGFSPKVKLPGQDGDIHALDDKEIIFTVTYTPFDKTFKIPLKVPKNFFRPLKLIKNLNITYDDGYPIFEWEDLEEGNFRYKIRLRKMVNYSPKSFYLYYATSSINDKYFNFKEVTDYDIPAHDYKIIVDKFEDNQEISNFFNRARFYYSNLVAFPRYIKKDSGVINDLENSCATFNIINKILHIPCLKISDSEKYWLDLQLTQPEPLIFKFKDFGKIK